MAAEAKRKLNLPETTTYVKFPLDFTGRVEPFKGLAIHAQLMLALIYTLNRIAMKKFGDLARITYEDFTGRFKMSRETVKKYKAELEARGIIECLSKSRYRILARFNKKDYVPLDDYLHTVEFEMTEDNLEKKRPRKSKKRLTRRSTLTLAFLGKMNQNPKTGGVFISSQARVGTILNMPRTTAGDSIREITAAGLMDCIIPDRNAACRRGLTQYKVAPEVLAVKRCAPKVTKPKPEKLPEAEIQPQKPGRPKQRKLQGVALTRYYNDLRHAAEDRADKAYNRAMSDDAYKGIRTKLNELSIQVAFAELNDPVKAAKLTQEIKELTVAGNKRLAELGIDEAEFKPQYKCRTCNDTGFDSSGNQCGCMKKLIKENLI